MTSFKLAVAAALSSLAVSAFALAPMQDADLSDVSGQDGVSIAANLNIAIGEFKYTDEGASISFNNIAVTGVIGATIDIIKAQVFSDAMTTLNVSTVDAVTTGFYPQGSDVVKIAIPKVAVGVDHALGFSVESIKMSNSTKSFGSIAMSDIKMQGTDVYIWAH